VKTNNTYLQFLQLAVESVTGIDGRDYNRYAVCALADEAAHANGTDNIILTVSKWDDDKNEEDSIDIYLSIDKAKLLIKDIKNEIKEMM
jgi:hypothetical protein